MPSRTRSVINSQSSINANRAKPNHRPNTPPMSDIYWIVCTQHSIISKTQGGVKMSIIQWDDYLITKQQIYIHSESDSESVNHLISSSHHHHHLAVEVEVGQCWPLDWSSHFHLIRSSADKWHNQKTEYRKLLQWRSILPLKLFNAYSHFWLNYNPRLCVLLSFLVCLLRMFSSFPQIIHLRILCSVHAYVH